MARSRRSVVLGVLLLVVTAGGALGAPGKKVPPVPAPFDLLGGHMKLWFTPDPEMKLSKELASFVSAAKHTVDVAMFSIDDTDFVKALVDQHKAGVAVRVVMDGSSTKAANKPLADAGILVTDKTRPAFMHTKLIVVDGKKLFAGSCNATFDGIKNQDNNGFFLTSTELAVAVTHFVDETYIHHLFGPTRKATGGTKTTIHATKVELYFSPEDKPGEKVVAAIDAAKSSITFLAYDMSDDATIKALVAAHDRGVAVEGVCETELARTGFDTLAAAGCKVLKDGNTSLMHDKVVIIDGKKVITGAFNFSHAAEVANDEDLFIFESSDVAASYEVAYAHIAALASKTGKAAKTSTAVK